MEEDKEEIEHYKKKPIPDFTLGFMREMRKNQTKAEKELWKHIRHDQLGVRFRRQYYLDGSIFDFYAPKIKLAIEVDGSIHQDDIQKKNDKERDKYYLDDHQILTLRFTNQEVLQDINYVLSTIEKTIATRLPSSLGGGVGGGGGEQIFDLGTGGGFPLLPLAICLPEAQLTGLDSTQKKIAAVERIAKELDLENLNLIAGRAEELGRDPAHREQYDLVLSRAVAELNVLLELCAPLCKVGGEIVLWKSMKIDKELEDSLMARAELTCHLIGQHEYELGGKFGKRQLLVFEKTSPTKEKYPRKVGEPKKNPIQ